MSQESDWAYISRQLQQEWETTTLNRSHPWEEIEDDVRFGWEQARSPEFDGAEWDDVEDLLQSRWEQNFPHRGFEEWRMVGEAVKLGFERAKEALT